MKDHTKINLAVWLPVILSLLALVGTAMALGRKDAKLEELSETAKDVVPLRIEVEILKATILEIKADVKEINRKQGEILEEIRKL